MKRLSSSEDSSAQLASLQAVKEEKGRKKAQIYTGEFQAMLDSLDKEEGEELGPLGDKKRRLSSFQVKALEKNFEVENKLDPESKVKLADELGLQPRQVAIWFQNRRARYKTKQLERDYSILRANYDSLKLHFDNLKQEKETLATELRELKLKLHLVEVDGGRTHSMLAQEFPLSSEPMNNASLSENNVIVAAAGPGEMNDDFTNTDPEEEPLISSSSFYDSPASEMLDWVQFSGPRSTKMDEEQQGFAAADEYCKFFWVDQTPSLHCYSPKNEYQAESCRNRPNLCNCSTWSPSKLKENERKPGRKDSDPVQCLPISCGSHQPNQPTGRTMHLDNHSIKMDSPFGLYKKLHHSYFAWCPLAGGPGISWVDADDSSSMG
ncbi:hypothetical protein SAY86_028760 [Trapa natans]|uniref:Homeobox-leucine zipper protein n=1 Tax=Trapa natans TaxID=22666 RepID=A0AAN7M151_TRANT|nr:hypothetical protein SAY86_028760 [Trapa natans]